jgi:ATP-dependent exoDNAse (exonuclease V) alpha subunit
MPFSPGDKVGRYEILAPIGVGGMGEVFRAKDSKLGRQVAIKVLPPHLAANAEARERLRREAQAAALLDHPFICKVFEIAEADGALFLVMEFLSGETLFERLRGEPAAERFGWRFQVRDKVIQTENDYKKEVFNGDIGTIERIDPVEQELLIRFDDRLVKYDFGELDEVSLAYAVTIHKSQGSEFPAVVMPVAMQHYMLLQRNLIYTGITRAKQSLVLVGQKKALGIAVRNDQSRKRYSGLLSSLKT